MARLNRYSQLIEQIFFNHYEKGEKRLEFARDEIESVAKKLSIALPKNLGDVIYSFRYRAALPDSIQSKAPAGLSWIIRPIGRGLYCFSLTKEWSIIPSPAIVATKVPDATPGMVARYSLSDEQALLVRLRYNRLIDILTGLTCYSLQNHLRTTVPEMGQVETDEIYVAVNKHGAHFVLPVQAKGGSDKHNVVQIEQDFALCAAKFPALVCRAIGAQFLADGTIALFEFELANEEVSLRQERHYQLVDPSELTENDLTEYRQRLDATEK
jgi:hypothetical protein